MISFDLETLYPSPPKPGENLIGEIIVSFVGIDKEVNTACALRSDMKTVQTLYTYGWKDRQVRISPRDPAAPENYTPLPLDDVAHIFFMHSPENAKCDQFSFAQFLSQNVTVSDSTYQAIIRPFIADFISEDVKYQLLTIELEDDNTIRVDLKDTEKKTYSEEELRLLRKPAKLR